MNSFNLDLAHQYAKARYQHLLKEAQVERIYRHSLPLQQRQMPWWNRLKRGLTLWLA